MNALKALIIDDESTSRSILRGYASKYLPEIEVVGEAEDILQAEAMIKLLQPDLLFLDVEMPKGNGFDLLEKIDTQLLDIIFVTAFDHYAIQAIQHSAANYLLKPVSIDELIHAVEQVLDQRARKESNPATKVLLENLQIQSQQQKKIVLPMLEGFEVVKIEDILYGVAQDNFTDFYFVDGSKKMICRSLKFYEDLLETSGFMRIHKSYLINLDHVVKYHRGKGGVVTMSNQFDLTLSAQKKDKFLEYFERGR